MNLPGLWDLLAPIAADEFLNRHWQKAPLHRRVQDNGCYDQLFRVEQIDDLLHAAAANASEFDYYAAGTSVPQADYTAEGNYVQLNRLLGLYAKGGTIHVSNIQKYVRSLRSFCRRMQDELLVDCEADFWLTRVNQFTPYLHFDRYDIFILQIHGRKRWRLFEPLHIPDSRIGAALAWEEVGEPIIDVVAEPGDLIYIPPHTPHVVTTHDVHSVHVGIGLHPLTWRQVLEIALDEARSRPNELSETVPLAFANTARGSPKAMLDLLQARVRTTLAGIDGDAFATRIYDRFLVDSRHTDDRHVFEQLVDCANPVEVQTRLALRAGTQGRAFIAADGRATIAYSGGGHISAPASHLRALEYVIASRMPFTASDIDPKLPIQERIALLQRAVDAGLCRRADTAS